MTRTVRLLLFLIAGMSLALFGRPGFGQGLAGPPPGTVEGRAPLTGKDASAARVLALEQAFRNQVMEEVASRLPEKTVKEKSAQLESAVYSRSREFIGRYQIVAEQPQGADYVVYLELEVAGALLDDALAKAGLLEMVKPPAVFLVVLEQGPAGPAESWWKSPPAGPIKPSRAEQALKQELAAHGYSVIEPQPGGPRIAPEKVTNPGAERDQVLRQLRKDFHADLLVVGKASTHPAEGRPVTQAELALAAVKLESQETLFRLERTAESAQTGGPGAGQALTLAAQAAASELRQWLQAQAAVPAEAGRNFNLTILNVFAYPVYRRVDERLRQPIPGVKSMTLRSLSPGRVVFQISGTVEPSALAKLLTQESFPGFHLETIEVSAESIRLNAKALAGSGASP
jgi:hypothetical protein